MVEIERSASFGVKATAELKVKWILADTEPEAPDGYERMPEFDIPLGALGTLFAFKPKPQ
jgi:hypothetical protein